jgi:hypothetical protein
MSKASVISDFPTNHTKYTKTNSFLSASFRLIRGQKIFCRTSRALTDIGAQDIVENSCRYFASPDAPCIFASLRTSNMKTSSGNIPFPLNSILDRRSGSESRIVLRVAHNNDEWIARIFDFPIPRFDQFSANSPSLVFRYYGHRTQNPHH